MTAQRLPTRPVCKCLDGSEALRIMTKTAREHSGNTPPDGNGAQMRHLARQILALCSIVEKVLLGRMIKRAVLPSIILHQHVHQRIFEFHLI